MLPVLDAGSISGWAAAAQLVGDQHARRSPLLLQQLAEQAFGGLLVAPTLIRRGYLTSPATPNQTPLNLTVPLHCSRRPRNRLCQLTTTFVAHALHAAIPL
jgi:hypothetical protein